MKAHGMRHAETLRASDACMTAATLAPRETGIPTPVPMMRERDANTKSINRE